MSSLLHIIPAISIAAAASLGAACTQQKAGRPDCASPDVLCVGMVTDVGKIDDKGFNQSIWSGIQQAQKELGAVVQYIETTDGKDYAKNIATFADDKYDVVVTAGFALAEATHAAAVRYPQVSFIGVSQAQSATKPNVAGLVFATDYGGFLVGALAALMSTSGKIGSVLGTDAVPDVWRYGEGYRAGARHARPNTEVSLVYHNDVGFDKTFTDPAWGKTTALAMIDKGVDVIFGAGGQTGNGALLGAAEKGIYAIGVDTDQYYTVIEAQKVLLSSSVTRIDDGTFQLIKLAKEGKMPSGNYFGKINLAPFHDLEAKVPAEVKVRMQEIERGLLDGTIKTLVPDTRPAP